MPTPPPSVHLSQVSPSPPPTQLELMFLPLAQDRTQRPCLTSPLPAPAGTALDLTLSLLNLAQCLPLGSSQVQICLETGGLFQSAPGS